MPGPYIRAEQLHQIIADALHQDITQLPGEWLRGAAQAVEDGYVDILAAVTAKGYSVDQLDSSDQRISLNRRRALWLLGQRLKGYGDFSASAFEADDPLPWLKDHPMPLTAAGVPLAPAAPGGSAVGGISVGMSTAADTITTQDNYALGTRFTDLLNGY